MTLRLENLCLDCQNVHQVPVISGARVQGMAMVCEYHRPGWPKALNCDVFLEIDDDYEPEAA